MWCKFLIIVSVNALTVWCFPSDLPLSAPTNQNVDNNAVKLSSPQHDLPSIGSQSSPGPGLSVIDIQSATPQSLIHQHAEISQPLMSTIQPAPHILQQTDEAHQPITDQQQAVAQHITGDIISTVPHYGASGAIQHEQNSYGLNQPTYGHQQQSENHHQSVAPQEHATQINADLVQNKSSEPISTQGLSGNIQSSEATPVTADRQSFHQDSHGTASISPQQSLDLHSADVLQTTADPGHVNGPLINTISLASEQNHNEYGLNQQQYGASVTSQQEHNLYGLNPPAYGQKGQKKIVR